MTSPLRRLGLLWRIPPDAPVLVLMLLRRRRDILRFGITKPSKLLVLSW